MKRRDLQIFSLSFLDCICCGLGAVILLLILSDFSAPMVIAQLQEDYRREIARLNAELEAVRGEERRVRRELAGRRRQLSEARERVARLTGDRSKLRGEFAGSRQDAAVQNTLEKRLARAVQELTPEMQRLLRRPPPRDDATVGGIPIDSEYIIFIIDTSGSMQRGAWGQVRRKISETLAIYPQVKGIQVMNDMGSYMFSQYRGRWIPDTPARRRAILSTLAAWRPFSNSSPVEGITAAVRTFFRPDRKISIYVFGDEFSGEAVQPVLDEVDRINRRGGDGNPLVRIHAVGFPVMIPADGPPGATGVRFAALMRALCHRNGGTFVGLNRAR